jgi:sigma-B regulation protein RsbU (phosphoserine phosphatase)
MPGDKVVFYTDGIVEAMNDNDEIFGFDRLLETVSGSPGAGAAELQQTILEKVHEFAGGGAQHDDLTIIVIQLAG